MSLRAPFHPKGSKACCCATKATRQHSSLCMHWPLHVLPSGLLNLTPRHRIVRRCVALGLCKASSTSSARLPLCSSHSAQPSLRLSDGGGTHGRAQPAAQQSSSCLLKDHDVNHGHVGSAPGEAQAEDFLLETPKSLQARGWSG